LQQFLNQAINQMYTALKVGRDGKIMPTIVVRQIPFSTNCIKEDPDLPLTRFLDLPRWKMEPVMVKEMNVGRSDATRKNMIKITGDARMYAKGPAQQEGWQVTMHPPIFDATDIARSGLKPHAQSINCTNIDILRKDGLDLWIEAVADWTFGSQYSLNGTIRSVGIQAPICEGDALELDGIVYYIESITDNCSISPSGVKSFDTIVTLTNGMPADQTVENGDEVEDFPVYPGFKVLQNGFFTSLPKVDQIDTTGDDSVVNGNNPGISEDRDATLNGEGV
jgi:hypothetical protein